MAKILATEKSLIKITDNLLAANPLDLFIFTFFDVSITFNLAEIASLSTGFFWFLGYHTFLVFCLYLSLLCWLYLECSNSRYWNAWGPSPVSYLHLFWKSHMSISKKTSIPSTDSHHQGRIWNLHLVSKCNKGTATLSSAKSHLLWVFFMSWWHQHLLSGSRKN